MQDELTRDKHQLQTQLKELEHKYEDCKHNLKETKTDYDSIKMQFTIQ